MVKSELIEMLQGIEGDPEVYVQHTAGDHWKTQLASSVDNVDEGKISWSSYHRQHKIDNQEEYDEDPDDKETVIILTIGQTY
jgi:uncharacterized Fe-S center protein